MNLQYIDLPVVTIGEHVNPALRYAPYRLRQIHLHFGVV